MGRIQIEKPVHSYSGDKWTTNRTNKKYLKRDFHSRCAYCDDKDFYYGGANAFHVEHFAPKEKFPNLIYRYENLLYACPYCNGSKSDKWPSDSADVNVVGTEGFINPCEDEYDIHLERNYDGKICSKSELGDYMISNLKLYLKRHQIFYKIDQIDQKRESLKQKIDEGKAHGRDMSKLEKILSALEKDFFSYYEIWKKLGPDD